MPNPHPRAEVRTIRTAADAVSAWRTARGQGSHVTPAHAPEWFDVIHTAYGHDPLYLMAEDDAGRTAMLPSFVVRRPIGGTVISSMPFLDTGGPCGGPAHLEALLVGRLIDEARRIGARSVELRCTAAVDAGVPAAGHKVNMALALAGADVLWRRLDKAIRNQVRKAERSGLTIESGGAEKLAGFYDVFAARMRDLGSPVHAYGFLRAVLDAFGDRARILLARKDTTTVGGLVALAFDDRLTVPWAACLHQYFPLCPNMLLYWEALRRACDAGFARFDFGRSTRGSGTYRFKQQWGAEEEPLFWYTIPLDRQPVAGHAAAGRGQTLAIEAWRRLPLTVTRTLGPQIRKFLTQ